MNFVRRRTDPLEVNLTPLIDVVFLLLIFFMVSTSFKLETQIDLELPTADGQSEPTDRFNGCERVEPRGICDQ